MLSKVRNSPKLLAVVTTIALIGVAVTISAFVRAFMRASPEAVALTEANEWEVTRIEPADRAKTGDDATADRVFFRNSVHVDHIGFELKYLGQLTHPDGSPIDVFQGRSCQDCKEGVKFFLYSPKSNQVADFAYPSGEVRSSDEENPENGEAPLYYSGRAFLGQCLGGDQATWKGIVAFGKYRSEAGDWQPVVQIYEFSADGSFGGRAVYQNLPDIGPTLKRVSDGSCVEMPPKNYTD